jgi:FlaA1/EpsC-like NDP-sugar epimerase
MHDPDPVLSAAAHAVTGRAASFLAEDIAELDADLRGILEGSTIAITGGGGFIARQVLFRLLDYRPARIVLIDVAENSLAATMRDVRSFQENGSSTQVESALADLTSPYGPRAIARLEDLQVLVHLAAIKHVRSGADELSIARMFDVNVGSAIAVSEIVSGCFPEARIMAVSTDKAAQPHTLMGASKRMMEVLLLAGQRTSVARFSNVAFSTGSLLDSWRRRIALDQPLPVPGDTRRFLVTPAEAADMCMAALAVESGRIVIPREGTLRSEELVDVARDFLEWAGRPGHPIEITAREFASEKPDECFVADGERAESWLHHLATVQTDSNAADARDFWSWMNGRLTDARAQLVGPEFHRRLAAAVPEYSPPHGTARDRH